MLFLNLLGDNDLGYRLYLELFENAYRNYNVELNFSSRIYFGRSDFEYIVPSHFSFYWEGFYHFRRFFIYYTHNCENGIDKNAYDNRRWDLLGIGFNFKNFNFILGHVVSPFRTSYDNQNYNWGFKIRGRYKFFDIYYLLIYTQSDDFKSEISLKFNYPIYLGFERRMDLKSLYDRNERDFYLLGFSTRKPFNSFKFYNLFKFSFEPSYNVLYLLNFGYELLNFEIEGISADNRWTPQFLVFEVYMCKGLCLKWFSKHELDLNYFNEQHYTFDNTTTFPLAISIGYKDANFGMFYNLKTRNFEKPFEIVLSYKNFKYKLYFDENFQFESSYYLGFNIPFLKNLDLCIGLFKNNFLKFENVFFGIYIF